MGKPKDMEEARILAKGGATALVSGALALCQYLAGDYAAVFALGAANAILPTATDYGTRALSPYERRRVDHVAILMLKEIKSHLDRRHEPRGDGFLNIDPSIRSSAQELCEGVLEISRSEYQEDKLPYLVYLYASVLFTDRVSKGEASRLFRTVQLLTYREMCILATLFNELESDKLRTNCVEKEEGSDELASLMQDCFELESWGLLSQVNHGQAPFYGQSTWAHVVPANLRITTYGSRLVELSRLLEIPEKDQFEAREIMRQ
jgi:hypothetical protein